MMDRGQRPHLSISSMDIYQGCPRQYDQKYNHGLREPSNPDLLVGSLFHKGYEAFQLLRMSGRRNGGAPHYEASRRDMQYEWEQRTTQPQTPVDWHKGDGDRQIDVDPAVIKVMAWRLFLAMAKVKGAQPPPLALEVGFRVPVPGYSAIDAIGSIDEISGDGATLIDMKSAGQKWTQHKADAAFQASVYWWALRQGLLPESGASARLRRFLKKRGAGVTGFEFQAAMKPREWYAKTPAQLAKLAVGIQVVRTGRNPEALDEYMREVLPELMRGIENKHFPPNPHHERCKGCWDACARTCPVRLAVNGSVADEGDTLKVDVANSEEVPF